MTHNIPDHLLPQVAPPPPAQPPTGGINLHIYRGEPKSFLWLTWVVYGYTYAATAAHAFCASLSLVRRPSNK